MIKLPGTVQLGDVVKDKLTNLKGAVIAIHYSLYGCKRVLIQPQTLSKGVKRLADPIFLDEEAVSILEVGKYAPASQDTGGPPSYGSR